MVSGRAQTKHVSGTQNLSFLRPKFIVCSFCHAFCLSSSQRPYYDPKANAGEQGGPPWAYEKPRNINPISSPKGPVLETIQTPLHQFFSDEILHTATELSSKPDMK